MSILPVLAQSRAAKPPSFLFSGLPSKVTMNCGSHKKELVVDGVEPTISRLREPAD